MVAPGIRFNDYLFSEPTRLADWAPMKCAGIFAILVRDPNWAPKPFQALFFGEFGNNAREILPANERVKLPTPLNAGVFFISVLPMPFSTTTQRSAVRNQLVWAYNPIWQANTQPASSDLARKIDELEKRHEEQTTLVQALLATVNKYLEPQQAESPRRRIGFLPQPLSAA